MDLGKCIDIKMNVTEAHRRAYKLIKFDSMFRNRFSYFLFFSSYFCVKFPIGNIAPATVQCQMYLFCETLKNNYLQYIINYFNKKRERIVFIYSANV